MLDSVYCDCHPDGRQEVSTVARGAGYPPVTRQVRCRYTPAMEVQRGASILLPVRSDCTGWS